MLTKEEIQVILNTLDKVEIHGWENLNYIVGIMALLRRKLNENEPKE